MPYWASKILFKILRKTEVSGFPNSKLIAYLYKNSLD